jgi:CHAD domain-containing protein
MARRRHALESHLDAALTGDEHAVHQARVASRRLREAIPVVGAVRRPDAAHGSHQGPTKEPALMGYKVRRLRRNMRRLTRALGPVRELDVALHMLAELRPVHPDEMRAIDALEPVLVRERDARRAYLLHRMDDARVRRLLSRLEAFERAIPRPDLVTAWRDELAERLGERALALRAAIGHAGALFLSDRLHAVRIAMKKLRYSLELAGEARVAATGASVRQLKEAQEQLGRLHDFDVLLRFVGAARSSEQPGSTLDGAFERLERGLEADSRTLHARYLRRQRGLVRVADRVIDIVAPHVAAHPVRASRRSDTTHES